MKLASERSVSLDGSLVVVSRDLARTVTAETIAPSLSHALEHWEMCEPRLRELYDRLNAGHVPGSKTFDPSSLMAPLPRAWQWLDASAFPSHGVLMQRAFNLPPIESSLPLMYQGMSHRFLAGTDDVPLPSETDGIDFEGEFGVISGLVPMGIGAAEALSCIRLAVQINDWSLRVIAPLEMKTGFGWVQAKPACSVAPVAVTLDELGSDWSNGRMTSRLRVEVNGMLFGDVPATEMQFGFHDLIAHAARTRDLCAGTLIGSGTISTDRSRETGSCCIAERRAIEMIDHGAARTEFLRFGDRVRMTATVTGSDCSPFGAIDQRVVRG